MKNILLFNYLFFRCNLLNSNSFENLFFGKDDTLEIMIWNIKTNKKIFQFEYE